MEDLFVSFIGAVTFSVIGYFYIKHRGKGKLARAFIPTLSEQEEQDPAAPDSSLENSKKHTAAHHYSALPCICFYSCASLLLSNGFSLKVVQRWLGHSDIKTTVNIYDHLDAARKQSIADKMGRLFSTAANE